MVIDGLGVRDENQGNAFAQADTPNLNKLKENHNYTSLEASGPAVGLPENYTGNSEVGHLHLGAGRIIPQRLTRINQAIEKNEISEKDALKQSLSQAQEKQSAVHIAGIISDGGIHGHIDHLKALLQAAAEYDIPDVYIHAFTDGRDVEPKSAQKYINQIQEWTKEYQTGQIATINGRYYSMDRDKNWDRTKKAYNAMAKAEGYQFDKPSEAINKAYNDGEYDYFVQPSINENYEGMKNQDELIFYNFRADRERQISEAFLKSDFEQFDNPIKPNFTSMLPYRKDFNNSVLFEKQIVQNTLGEELENQNLTQLRVAESQKTPHVTYFFNGQREIEFEGEERRFVESDKIKAYDQKPEMHAKEITKIVTDSIEEENFNFTLLNYANCDLVGHTGDLNATITAVETVDKQIGKLISEAKQNNYDWIITSDHGNSEDMGTEKNPNTSHTLNSIPLITNKELNEEIEGITDVRELIKNILVADT